MGSLISNLIYSKAVSNMLVTRECRIAKECVTSFDSGTGWDNSSFHVEYDLVSLRPVDASIIELFL